MSAPKWTPGPWRHSLGVVVADRPQGEWQTTAVAYVGDEWRHQGGLCYGEERDANAALIAAAPELYAALHAILSKPIAGSVPVADWQQFLDSPEMELARHALAKARGERP